MERTATRASDSPFVRLLVIAVALAIAGIGFLGGAYAAGWLADDSFDLNAEHNIPTGFSALLLAASAGLVVAYSVVVHPGERYLTGLLMAFLLAFMALDEIATVHEKLEANTGIDWQTLYLPLVLLAAVVWVRILRELLAERLLAVLWFLAAAAWFGSQVLEVLEYDSDDHRVRLYTEMTVVEELLEMIGSSLFGLSMLLAIVIVVRNRGGSNVGLGEHTFDR